jgi:hypothetical protein
MIFVIVKSCDLSIPVACINLIITQKNMAC